MTRDQWLNGLANALRPTFIDIEAPLPEKLRVSCGWPSTKALAKKGPSDRSRGCDHRDVSDNGIDRPRISLMLTLALLAILAADPAKPEAAPAIPPEIQAEFWRATAALAQLAPAWNEAQEDQRKANAALAAACGEKYAPKLDAKRLVCAPKPEAPKPEAK